jgi:hypothetical protein
MLNKKIVMFCGAALFCFAFGVEAATTAPALPKNCTKDGTELSMTFTDAQAIAAKSSCVQVGALMLDKRWCNNITGTWWIRLKTKMQGCSPACVVNVENKTATTNYMCMGLLRSDKRGK